MQKEQKTLLVSVNTEVHDQQDALIQEVGKQIGQGWKVIQTIPVEGSTHGPGGNSTNFMRLQVTVEREIDSENVIVDTDRGGAADLKDVGQVSAAFDEPVAEERDEDASSS